MKFAGEDIHGEGGQFIMSYDAERPKFDKGSSLWTQPTFAVEQYIQLLETRLVEYDKQNQGLQSELSAIKKNRELTIKWAKGEVEN